MTDKERQLDRKVTAYSNAVEDAKLEVIRLISSSFNVNPSFEDANPAIKRYVTQEVTAFNFSKASGSLLGMVECKCWMGPETRADPKADASKAVTKDEKLLAINAKYLVLFNVEGEHDQESLETFFYQIAPISVWPYFRVHVASTAAEADVNIPTLPLKKLIRKINAAKNYKDPDDTVQV